MKKEITFETVILVGRIVEAEYIRLDHDDDEALSQKNNRIESIFSILFDDAESNVKSDSANQAVLSFINESLQKLIHDTYYKKLDNQSLEAKDILNDIISLKLLALISQEKNDQGNSALSREQLENIKSKSGALRLKIINYIQQHALLPVSVSKKLWKVMGDVPIYMWFFLIVMTTCAILSYLGMKPDSSYDSEHFKKNISRVWICIAAFLIFFGYGIYLLSRIKETGNSPQMQKNFNIVFPEIIVPQLDNHFQSDHVQGIDDVAEKNEENEEKDPQERGGLHYRG